MSTFGACIFLDLFLRDIPAFLFNEELDQAQEHLHALVAVLKALGIEYQFVFPGRNWKIGSAHIANYKKLTGSLRSENIPDFVSDDCEAFSHNTHYLEDVHVQTGRNIQRNIDLCRGGLLSDSGGTP